MDLSIVRRKKRRSRAKHADKQKTNEKNKKPSIPAKRQRLRIKVSSMGRIGLQVEELHPKALDDMQLEEELAELPKRNLSKKQKRSVERSHVPHQRRKSNTRRRR